MRGVYLFAFDHVRLSIFEYLQVAFPGLEEDEAEASHDVFLFILYNADLFDVPEVAEVVLELGCVSRAYIL